MSLLKSEKICAAFSWNATGNRLAAASVAGAMDDDFSTDAYIHIYDVSLHNFDDTRMPLLATAAVPDRVHKLDWSSHGSEGGIIAAGLTDGTVCVWSVSALLERGIDTTTPAADHPALLYESRLHQSAVKGLQFNPVQPYFLATAGSDKELYIWSFQDPKAPTKVPSISNSTQVAEITDLRWNPRYQHILAVALSNGNVVVWDLKSKRPASTFSVSPNGTAAASALTWHPDVATQLVVARDDPTPVIQFWDLKKATAPFREISVHSGGVLAMSWSPFDLNVLVSCGRDGRTCFSNPNTGALLGELPRQDNWVFDVKWAPRTPAVVASASYDSLLAIHATQSVCSATEAPKWLCRPSPAVFAYGGRIAQAKRTTLKIVASTSTEGTTDSLTKMEATFNAALSAAPNGTEARAEFIATLRPGGLECVVAAARCTVAGHKGPLLEHLGVSPVSKDWSEVELPTDAAELDDAISQCIASGNLSSAVTLCIKAERFDDAFAIAEMSGKDDKARVYDAYLEWRTPKCRFAKYLRAIAHQNYDDLSHEAAQKNVPWSEVLALYSTVVRPQEYPRTCTVLGNALRESGELDPALTAFVAGGDVDNAAATLVAKKDRSPVELVLAVTALEQTVQRQACNQEFAEVLASHANSLAFEGNFAAAMSYASRAAALGVQSAAVVADRVRYLVPREKRLDVARPFRLVCPVPDPVSPECQMLAGSQKPLASLRPTHHHTAPTEARNAHSVAGAPQHPSTAPPSVPAYPPSLQENGSAPRHFDAAAGYAPQQQAPPTIAPQPNATQPISLGAPARAANQLPGVPPHQHSLSHQHPQLVQHPPPQRPSLPLATGGSGPQTPTMQPPSNSYATSTTTQSTAPVPRPSPQGGLNCLTVDTSAVPQPQQPIVSAISAAASAITDKRRRDAVDKAATELFRRLASGAVSPAVVALLLEYTAKLGTPESKQVWKVLNDKHFDDVSPFLNIKFL